MSVKKLNRGDVETFTVVTNPYRTYVSSSSGVVGSLFVFPRRSSSEKEVGLSSAFIDATHSEETLEAALRAVQMAGTKAVNTEPVSVVGVFYIDTVYTTGG